MVQRIYNQKALADSKKKIKEIAAYRNTKVRHTGQKERDLVDSVLDEKLRSKIEANQELYDFKVVRRKLILEKEERVYLSKAEVDARVRLPHIQSSPEKLLNVYDKHKFSFDHESLSEIFKRVARALPLDSKNGGMVACTQKYSARNWDDPRFSDKRMQALLTALSKNMHKFDAVELSHLLYSSVRLRLPDEQFIGSIAESLQHKLTKTPS